MEDTLFDKGQLSPCRADFSYSNENTSGVAEWYTRLSKKEVGCTNSGLKYAFVSGKIGIVSMVLKKENKGREMMSTGLRSYLVPVEGLEPSREYSQLFLRQFVNISKLLL